MYEMYKIYEMYEMYEMYEYNDDLSEGLSVINNTTDLSEELPVINNASTTTTGVNSCQLSIIQMRKWSMWLPFKSTF